MKKILIFTAIFCVFLISVTFAQKKIAVVTFFVNKKINVESFGGPTVIAVDKLSDDPGFNMEGLLKNFHTQFFDNYSKEFPFQLIPEDQVINNAGYKAFMPAGVTNSGVFDVNKYITVIPGYKVLLDNLIGKQNENDLLKIFDQADGIMEVNIHFRLAKTGIGGMGIVRVSAEASIQLYNKSGDRVFSIDEDAKSKSVNPLVAGVPVITVDRILPMCESAMTELMAVLEKDMPKMIKKADKKL